MHCPHGGSAPITRLKRATNLGYGLFRCKARHPLQLYRSAYRYRVSSSTMVVALQDDRRDSKVLTVDERGRYAGLAITKMIWKTV
ncbi:hypothetical protein [Leptolyngbya sp. GB1-A1]|uniref:hypothetical protein n=1 Tax=unclassified Leptolyngbya TaxID=2650499 RepID=UPI0019879BB6|nr:hypothetical protein [Cyanobacteria bacterium FACHB-502]